MILIVCSPTLDPLHKSSKSLYHIAQSSFNYSPKEYEFFYNAFSEHPPVPQIQDDENLFIISHSVYWDMINEQPMLGDGREDSYCMVTANELLNTIRYIFTDDYIGNIYINACQPTDKTTDSFAEMFSECLYQQQIEAKVYGRISGTLEVTISNERCQIIPPSWKFV